MNRWYDKNQQKIDLKMINLTEKEIERYHEMFKKLDTNSDGKIDVYDLVVLFDKIKHPNLIDNSKSTQKRESNLLKAKVLKLINLSKYYLMFLTC